MNLSSKAARVVVEAFPEDAPLDAAVVSFSGARVPAILESSDQWTTYGRFSIFASDPLDTFRHDRYDAGCPFRGLAERAANYPSVGGQGRSLPFSGAWIGYFTYEAGLGIEGLVSSASWPVGLPLAEFHLYDAAAVYDHVKGTWSLVAVEWPDGVAPHRPSAGERLNGLRERLLARSGGGDGALVEPVTSAPEPNLTVEEYCDAVARVKGHIEAGDIYQANLTQRFTVRTDAAPETLYRRLRRASPSSHAAFLPWGQHAVISSSPELFLRLTDGHVVTRPIKGTRPRTGDPTRDIEHRRALATSEKERAELAMIIDLLRNDLGRVCSYGTIRVERAWDIEEHPTVFHQVATISGSLAPGRSWVDLLLATYPGGSITGAPKIRAMQIIDELEPTPRGVYCGSIGMIGLDGSLSLNIAIRTIVQQGDEVSFHAGGAIVADSTPEQEYDECIAKAGGMLRALCCATPRRTDRRKEVTIG